ncbi:MAG: indole-3-glycerol phosphate synthase TrpC [Pelosinus sp.]|nr:indole-3-glycerol phosphate synthase TrpC [Pelosinus sp.]
MLDAILKEKYQEIKQKKQEKPLVGFQNSIKQGTHRFKQALMNRDWALIAECKQASPSKGVFTHGKSVGELARIYAKSGADVLSVLTDKHFNGSLTDIAAAKTVCDLPILRKDFVVDSYQIYEARAAEADGVLLIAAVLSDEKIVECLKLVKSLGMDALVEVHTLAELQRVLKTPAEIIGINNRDLKTFKTDIRTTQKLLAHSAGKFVISESGVFTAEDALLVKSWGAKGILVGEGLVTAPDIAARTRELALI